MNRAAGMVLRDEVVAGRMAFGTADNHGHNFSGFVEYLKEAGINRFEQVSSEVVIAYVHNKLESVTNATAQNIVSTINTVLSIASKGRWEAVSATKDAGIGQRSSVRETAPASIDRDLASLAIAAAAAINERCGAMAQLCRELGLRSAEAAKVDAKAALDQARETGCVRIERGTKGGQPRNLELRQGAAQSNQIAALERAALAQGGGRSLISPDQTYKQFREGDIRDAREAMQRAGLSGFHDLRSAYACERYKEETGHDAPCVAGERLADKHYDRDARLVISEELGHHREDVVASYVGSAR